MPHQDDKDLNLGIEELAEWVRLHAERVVEPAEMVLFQVARYRALEAFLRQGELGTLRNACLAGDVPAQLTDYIATSIVALDQYLLAMVWDQDDDVAETYQRAYDAWWDVLGQLDGMYDAEEVRQVLEKSELRAQISFVSSLIDGDCVGSEGQLSLPIYLTVDCDDSIEFEDCDFGDSPFVDPEMGVTPCEEIEPWTGVAWSADGEKIAEIDCYVPRGVEAQAQLAFTWEDSGMTQTFFVRAGGAENDSLARKLIEIEQESSTCCDHDVAFIRAMHQV